MNPGLSDSKVHALSHIMHVSWFPQIPYQTSSVGLTDSFVCWVGLGVHSPSVPFTETDNHLHSCKIGQSCPLYKMRIKSFLCSLPAMWAWAASLISLSLSVPIYKMEWIHCLEWRNDSWRRNDYYFIFTFYPASLNVSILLPYAFEKLTQT